MARKSYYELWQEEERAKNETQAREQLISKLSLALVMQVPKALEKDGFLRYIEAENIVKQILEQNK